MAFFNPLVFQEHFVMNTMNICEKNYIYICTYTYTHAYKYTPSLLTLVTRRGHGFHSCFALLMCLWLSSMRYGVSNPHCEMGKQIPVWTPKQNRTFQQVFEIQNLWNRALDGCGLETAEESKSLCGTAGSTAPLAKFKEESLRKHSHPFLFSLSDYFPSLPSPNNSIFSLLLTASLSLPFQLENHSLPRFIVSL
jgi:hypothetical protein